MKDRNSFGDSGSHREDGSFSADTASGTEDEEEQGTQESEQSGTAAADRGTEAGQE